MGSVEKWISEAGRIALSSHIRGVFGVRLPRKDRSIDPFLLRIREAKKTVRSWGGELYFVYLPTYERYSEWLGDDPVEREGVLAAVCEVGIRTIAIHTLFASYPDPRRFWVSPSSHYTAEAYRIIADSVQTEL